jgi:hypothetical protein
MSKRLKDPRRRIGGNMLAACPMMAPSVPDQFGMLRADGDIPPVQGSEPNRLVVIRRVFPGAIDPLDLAFHGKTNLSLGDG